MKRSIIYNSLMLSITALLLSFTATAQPKAGSVIIGNFHMQSGSPMVASIISVNGKEFTCRFSHSNSTYVFLAEDIDGTAKVVSSKGGKFAKDTWFYFVEYFIVNETYECILNKTEWEPVIVKFGDGKSFLGDVSNFTADGGYDIRFWHSWSKYSFDKNGVVIKSGGAYPAGKDAKIFCASAAYPAPMGLKLPQLKEQKLNKQ
ncbi:MAG: hypothetical protein H7Y86_00300 [Rhizobacter sp.]|nr:hypothetical protein [Ferruginibacter sp.]